MTDKLLDALRLIEKQADNFTTHWMDDDDPEDHAAAEQAQDEIAEASAAIKAAFAAQRAMLAALRDMRTQLRAHVKLDVKKHYSLMVADVAADKAIAAANAAGIGGK